MNTPHDAPFDELLHAAREGASWALAELWRRWSPSVAGFLRSRGSTEPDEGTSEVFLAAFRALPGFQGGEKEFRGLVFTIAQRRVVDDYRRRRRRPETRPLEVDDDRRADLSAEERVLESERRTHARGLLDRLAPDQRDVLVLRIFGELTVDEVAAALGKSPGAVKQLQRRGLDSLRRALVPATTTDPTEEVPCPTRSATGTSRTS